MRTLSRARYSVLSSLGVLLFGILHCANAAACAAFAYRCFHRAKVCAMGFRLDFDLKVTNGSTWLGTYGGVLSRAEMQLIGYALKRLI